MRAHQLKNGVVINTLIVNDLGDLPDLIDGVSGGIGDTYEDGTFTNPAPAIDPIVTQSVTPRQIRQALTRAGLRASVEAAVTAGDQDTKDWYEFATEFERNNTHVVSVGVALGVTDLQLDDLWTLAGSL